jgi:hypothetical protein
METQLHWYKKWYESQYQLFSDEQEIGEISPVAFSSKTIACMNGRKYVFKPKAFLLKEIDILDANSMEQVGKIYFIGVGIKGVIILNAKDTYQLRCDNLFTARWTISHNRQEVITYTGNHMRGKIKTNFSNQVLLLAGLYAGIFQWRKLAFLLIIFVPLIVIFLRTV